MSNYDLGQNGMNWWVGEVVNVNDPHQSGRVQVRIFGRHDNKTTIPDDALPWALPIQPVTSAAHGRMGTAPVGLVKGSKVMGFWADNSFQQPIVWGSVGRSGDAVPQRYDEYGAPLINTAAGGSIPSTAQVSANGTAIANNPYSQLSPNRTSIQSIDSGSANTTSVSNQSGSVMTVEVEKRMAIPKIPTIGSIDPNDTSNVLSLIQKADPSGQGLSVLPCLPAYLLASIDVGALLSSYANKLIKTAVRAIKNALIKLAQDIGLFKVLYALNETARTIAAVANLLDAIASLGCAPNHVNQKNYTDADIIFASVVYDLNELAGYIHGSTTFLSENVTSSIVGSALLPPISMPINLMVGAPPNDRIVNTPPENYIQVYRSPQTDPYPGYIEWKPAIDDGNVPQISYYTLRNGQPNYSSANQHMFFQTEVEFSRNALNSFDRVKGSFDKESLSTAINRTAQYVRKVGPMLQLGIAVIENPSLLIGLGISMITSVINSINSLMNYITSFQSWVTSVNALSSARILKSVLKFVQFIKNIFQGKFVQSQMRTYKQKTLIKTALRTSIV